MSILSYDEFFAEHLDKYIDYVNLKDPYQKEEFEDLAYFEPFYLKEFKAGKPKVLV